MRCLPFFHTWSAWKAHWTLLLTRQDRPAGWTWVKVRRCRHCGKVQWR